MKRDFACSRCGKSRRGRKGRYCADCHAAYMREWRQAGREKTSPARQPKPDRGLNHNTRSYTRAYIGRGIIEVEPCLACGAGKAEVHHHDYTNPFDISWLCRPCHEDWHRCLSAINRSTFIEWLSVKWVEQFTQRRPITIHLTVPDVAALRAVASLRNCSIEEAALELLRDALGSRHRRAA